MRTDRPIKRGDFIGWWLCLVGTTLVTAVGFVLLGVDQFVSVLSLIGFGFACFGGWAYASLFNLRRYCWYGDLW